MPNLLVYAEQERYEEVLGLKFLAPPKEIDSKKITLATKYSSDTSAKMAINKAASILKSELQDTGRKSFLDRIRRIGHNLYVQNNYLDALPYLSQAIIQDGQENDYILKVTALIRIGRLKEADLCLRECEVKFPNSAAAQMIRQNQILRTTNINDVNVRTLERVFKNAKEITRKFTKMWPMSKIRKSVFVAAALILLALSAYIILMFEKQVHINRDASQIWAMAQQLAKDERYEEALGYTEKLLNYFPNSKVSRKALPEKAKWEKFISDREARTKQMENLITEAYSLKNAGRLDESLACISQILTIEKQNRQAIKLQSELKELIEQRQVQEEKEEDFLDYSKAALAYEKREEMKMAIEAYTKALAIKPEDKEIQDKIANCQHNQYISRAQEFEQDGDLNNAINNYIKALSFKHVLSTQVKLDTVRQVLQAKIEKEYREAKYDKWLKQAQDAEKENDLSEAVRLYTKSQEYADESLKEKIDSLNKQILEKDKQAKFKQLLTISKTKDGKEALSLLEQALQIYPDNIEALSLKKKIESTVNLNQNSQYRVYIVQPCDTLYYIADKELGSGKRWKEIYTLNQEAIGDNLLNLHIGQALKIPTWQVDADLMDHSNGNRQKTKGEWIITSLTNRQDLIDHTKGNVRDTVLKDPDAEIRSGESKNTVNEKLVFDAREAKRRQLESAGSFRVSIEKRIILGNCVKMEFVLIPASSFYMGSPGIEKDRILHEGPIHRVRISRSFYMSRCEITQDQYLAVMGINPSKWKGGARPVEQVSWDDAVLFCRKMSAQYGGYFRLPTEAEWEYACRGGTQTRFFYGDDLDYSQLGDYAWFEGNSDYGTHPVGQKKPNSFGLCDMYGNVWEWCSDWYTAGFYRESPAVDPQGPLSGYSRVCRGGCWHDSASRSRSAYRVNITPDYRYNGIGFRVVLDLN